MFTELSEGEISKVFDVNVFGCLWVLRAAMRTGTLKHVTQLCSVVSFLFGCQISEYVASKHAIHGFLHTIRLELKEKNIPITTTGIYPWVIDTGMFDGVRPRFFTNLFFPMLQEDYVGQVIFKSTCERRPQVAIPRAMNLAFFAYTILPVPVYDRVLKFLTQDAMKPFVGRHK
jgi:all-trans-retinol dehydrogenase (NAD+)